MSALTAHTSNVAAEVTDTAFLAEAGRVRDLVGSQLVLSQGRCVDHLLDLLNLTTEPSVRAELADFLAQIRLLSAVEGALMRGVLDVVVAALEVESAYARFVLR
jgi:hypothetical protein